ncbi:MAG: hypothetical protein HND58_01110 [Planctomycetota bacterium]|nr:MAG: hypothetical protein HND58_01110 [Planctomycetota bacterium]
MSERMGGASVVESRGGDGVPGGAGGRGTGVGGGQGRGVELEAHKAVALGDPLEALAERGVKAGRAEVGE